MDLPDPVEMPAGEAMVIRKTRLLQRGVYFKSIIISKYAHNSHKCSHKAAKYIAFLTRE